MQNKQLEEKARDLLKDMWYDRDRLAPGCGDDPFRILDPRLAAIHLDFRYDEAHELRNFGRQNGHHEVAGIIDQQARKIAISMRFSVPVRRFTAGHEIAHAVLHPAQSYPGLVMHRDRPLAGISTEKQRREPAERDADYFSACFLVPAGLLEKSFTARFGSPPLRLNEASAFWLSPSNPNALLEGSRRDFAFALAGAISYAREYFSALTEEFGVSLPTMAYRLMETGMIEV